METDRPGLQATVGNAARRSPNGAETIECISAPAKPAGDCGGLGRPSLSKLAHLTGPDTGDLCARDEQRIQKPQSLCLSAPARVISGPGGSTKWLG